jgi:hypothetical protein
MFILEDKSYTWKIDYGYKKFFYEKIIELYLIDLKQDK